MFFVQLLGMVLTLVSNFISLYSDMEIMKHETKDSAPFQNPIYLATKTGMILGVGILVVTKNTKDVFKNFSIIQNIKYSIF